MPPGVAGVLHRTDELHGSEERIDRGRVQHSAPVFGRPVNERARQSAGDSSGIVGPGIEACGEKTLTDAEAAKLRNKIVRRLQQELGATLRDK